ncbi:MAG: type II toxin-antitoxin system HicA family toxin [Acidobacteriaceae bacterium]|nr:type II toxin-antitoxin system HicA family toxin [Acidobacteriaceae bacterium]
MSRTPRVTGTDLIAALIKAGFHVIRVRGSHHFLRHEDGRTTVVAKQSAPACFNKILRDCQLTAEQLTEFT